VHVCAYKWVGVGMPGPVHVCMYVCVQIPLTY